MSPVVVLVFRWSSRPASRAVTPSPSAARIRTRNSSSGRPLARAWAVRSSWRARLMVRSAAMSLVGPFKAGAAASLSPWTTW